MNDLPTHGGTLPGVPRAGNAGNSPSVHTADAGVEVSPAGPGTAQGDRGREDGLGVLAENDGADREDSLRRPAAKPLVHHSPSAGNVPVSYRVCGRCAVKVPYSGTMYRVTVLRGRDERTVTLCLPCVRSLL